MQVLQKSYKIVFFFLLASVAYGKEFTVHATREGLIGKTTADGTVIRPDSVFVALPTRLALGRHVRVVYGSKSVICRVRDVGPWSTRDPWIFTGTRPLAEQGARRPEFLMEKWGKPKNKAGIDLSDGLWDMLGIPRHLGIVQVKVELVDT